MKRARRSGFFKRRIEAIVLGANDGIITTFAVVSGVAGGGLSRQVTVILGFANLVADGISMGASNYLGKKSEKDRDAKAGLRGPLEAALATFAAFVVVGLIPLVTYVLPVPRGWQFPLASVLTMVALFTFGAMRAVVTKRRWVFSGLEMLAIGAIAAGAAYGAGALLRSIVGVSA